MGASSEVPVPVPVAACAPTLLRAPPPAPAVAVLVLGCFADALLEPLSSFAALWRRWAIAPVAARGCCEVGAGEVLPPLLSLRRRFRACFAVPDCDTDGLLAAAAPAPPPPPWMRARMDSAKALALAFRSASDATSPEGVADVAALPCCPSFVAVGAAPAPTLASPWLAPEGPSAYLHTGHRQAGRCRAACNKHG